MATSSAASAGDSRRRFLAEIGQACGPHILRDCRRTAPASDRSPGCRPWRGAARGPAPRRSRRVSPRACADARSSSRTVCIVKVEAPETTRPMRDELADGAQDRGRVDAGMAVEPPILGGDQHAAIERIDAIDGERQAPLVVARSESRAGSSRRAPEPAPTDRGCGRAPEAADVSQMPPREEAATTIAATRTSTRRLIRRLIVRLAPKLSLRRLPTSLPIAVRPAVSGSYMSSTTSAG